MTEKRYSHNAIVIVDHLKKDLIYIDGKDALLELAEYVDRLQDENKQLKQILNELSNRLQFDVENGIRSYPVKLSEYLSNALKELQE